jgi:hypothetical protein
MLLLDGFDESCWLNHQYFNKFGSLKQTQMKSLLLSSVEPPHG